MSDIDGGSISDKTAALKSSNTVVVSTTICLKEAWHQTQTTGKTQHGKSFKISTLPDFTASLTCVLSSWYC